MDTLSEIGFKYGTDKCPQIKHHFTEFYNELFKDRREQIRKVVEIGIGKLAPRYTLGASLYMWREYFPNAQIFGLDNDPDMMFIDDRITTYLCDQTSIERLILATTAISIGQSIDLFIDDGLHTPESQIFTCRTVMPFLDRSAVYAIEDAAHASQIVKALPEYDCKVLRRSRIKYQDDRLVIVRHRG